MTERPVPEEFAWDPAFAMGEESSAIAQRVWPRFLVEESDVPQPSLTLHIDEQEFHRRYPAWGLRAKANGRLVAYVNAVLLREDPDAAAYPAEGWQHAIEAGGRADTPNGLCLVVANVDPAAQKSGISTLLLERGKTAARELGFRFVLAPVRPSHFHERPELSFDAYVNLRRADGLPTDPWLRAHERAGATMLNICPRSTVVKASVGRWSTWTGQSYPSSGTYPLAGGLAPLDIDLESGIGTYAEPNVWFRYRW